MALQEKTLNKPLSGAEVVEAIVVKIREQLKRDCFLNPIIAYSTFSFQATIKIQFQNTGTNIKETQVGASGAEGEGDPEADTESIDTEITDIPKPPNQVRVETHQGVPVIATKPQGGVEEKKLKYTAPKKSAKAR